MPDQVIVEQLDTKPQTDADVEEITVAQFNIRELTTATVQRPNQGGPMAAAAIIQRIDPDVLLVNELSNSAQQEWNGPHNAVSFYKSYLQQPLPPGFDPIRFHEVCVPPSNTGIPTGENIQGGAFELEPGSETYADNCHGYGEYPGRYAMALYSKYPIRESEITTLRKIRWQDMPDSLLPADFRSRLAELGVDLRLPSKNHADVPLSVGDSTVHGLITHPTPPRYDDEANINGRRCHDEIRLLADYIGDGEYLIETGTVTDTLSDETPFVVMGDLNAAPNKEDDTYDAIAEHLLTNDRINADLSSLPTSPGAADRGDPIATHRFEYEGREHVKKADYVLPSTEFERIDAGVIWPGSENDQGGLRDTAFAASDHHLVWRTLRLTN